MADPQHVTAAGFPHSCLTPALARPDCCTTGLHKVFALLNPMQPPSPLPQGSAGPSPAPSLCSLPRRSQGAASFPAAPKAFPDLCPESVGRMSGEKQEQPPAVSWGRQACPRAPRARFPLLCLCAVFLQHPPSCSGWQWSSAGCSAGTTVWLLFLG